MSLAADHSRQAEADGFRALIQRLADLVFDDLPAALRGALQVLLAVLLGAMVGGVVLTLF
jgi:hypothetical protein